MMKEKSTKQINKKSFLYLLEKLISVIKKNSKVQKRLGWIIGAFSFLLFFLNILGIFVIFPKFDLTKPDPVEFLSKDINTLKVLIIPFKNYNNSNFKVEESIADRLKEKIEIENLNLEVIYDSLAKPTTLFKEAEAIAKTKRSRVDIVLFGEFEGNNYKLNLLNLTKEKIKNQLYTEYFNKIIRGKYITNTSSRKIKNLNQLEDQEYIIYKILFHTAIKNNELENANKVISNLEDNVYKTDNKQIKEDYSNMVKLLSYFYNKNKESKYALEIIERNIRKFPKDIESRQLKVSMLFKNLFESLDFETFELNNDIIQEIRKELQIVITMDIEEKNMPYLLISLTDFITTDFKGGINNLELASRIEKEYSLFPVSTVILNVFKGDFTEDIKLINSLLNENDSDSQIVLNISLAILNILNGDIDGLIANISFLESNQLSDSLLSDKEFTKMLHNRKDMLDNEVIDSIYKLVQNRYSDDPKTNIQDALLLASFTRNREDLKNINNKLKRAVKFNPDYAKFFSFNFLPKDSIIFFKNIISKYKDSISKDSTNYKALSLLSNSYRKLGLGFISKYYSRKAISVDLNSLLYIDNPELSDSKKDMLRKSFLYYSALLNSNTKTIAYQKVAIVLKEFNINDYSRDYYKFAIMMSPSNYKLYSEIGWLEIEQKQYKKALEYFKKQYEIIPESFSATYNIFSAYYYLKKWNLAYEYLLKSMKKYNHSITYTSLDKLTNHKKYIESQLNTTPNNVYISELDSADN